MGRRGGGGAARAPQASPQGEKAFAILKSFTLQLEPYSWPQVAGTGVPRS